MLDDLLITPGLKTTQHISLLPTTHGLGQQAGVVSSLLLWTIGDNVVIDSV